MGYAFHLGKQFALLPQAGGYLNTGIGGSGFCSGHDPYNQPYTNAIEIFSSRNNLYYRPFSEWMQACFSLPAFNTGKFG